jgi:adenosylcobinamide kinase/adenosylcobinamide-phosphate guanylyltransferase
MAFSLLITGGARSGKSSFAEQRVREFGAPLVYIATAEAFDNEMKDRVALHQARRGPDWQTFHAPLNLSQALREADGKGPCLVDCLTIWLNNMIFAEQETVTAADHLVTAIVARSDPVVLVTNEVGSGIVPENALARRFRDEAGRMNQIIAAAVDEVYVSISGIPVRIKPQRD